MTTYNQHFNSKGEAFRYFIFEFLSNKANNEQVKSVEIRNYVEQKLTENKIDFKENDPTYNDSIKRLVHLENSPIKKGKGLGLYYFDSNSDIKTFEQISELKVSDKPLSTNQMPKGKSLEDKITRVLMTSKQDLLALLDGQSVPLSYLVSGNEDKLEEFKEQINKINTAVEELDNLIEILR